MNTREFAKKNEKKTDWVRSRCKEGLIPTAEKKSGRWDIPEDAELPPCTGREAALILENIIERNKGIEVCLVPARMGERGEAALGYLMNNGFISNPDDDGAITVAKRGSDFLKELRGAKKTKKTKNTVVKKKKTTFEISGSLGSTQGIVPAHLGLNYRAETEEGAESEEASDKRAG